MKSICIFAPEIPRWRDYVFYGWNFQADNSLKLQQNARIVMRRTRNQHHRQDIIKGVY